MATKRCLRKTVGRARFSLDEMHIVEIVEIEGIINSRPISYLDPLTPLVGRRLLNLPDNLTCYEEVGDEEFELCGLQRRAKHLSGVLNHFWRRWRRWYLLELRDAHRCTQVNQRYCRCNRCNGVPSSRIRLRAHNWCRWSNPWSHQAGKITTLRRPVQLLYPLGVP